MTAEQRLERAEKQIRQLKVLVIGLVVIVVGGFTLGQAKPQAPTTTPQAVTIPKAPEVPEVIKAKRFEVVNDNGRGVVKLESFEGRGVITTSDNSGTRPLACILGDGVFTFNSKGQKVVEFGATENGNGAVTTYNGNGRMLVRIGTTGREHRSGAVGTFNGQGQQLVLLGVTEGGYGAFSTYNEEGGILVGLGATDSGVGTMATFGKMGQKFVSLGTSGSPNPVGAVSSYNSKGQVYVHITGTESGGGIEVFSKTGERVVQAYADEYGMGYVGVFDRQGKGQTLTPR